MAMFLALGLLAVGAAGIVAVLLRGDRTWLDEPAPAPEPSPEPTPEPHAPVAGTPVPAEAEPADVFVLDALPEPLPEPGPEPAPGRARPRRRPRFEDVADLTIPEPVDLVGVAVSGPAPPVPEKAPVHIPITTRLFGAVRLVLLVALSAAAVALAFVGAGYMLIEKLLGN